MNVQTSDQFDYLINRRKALGLSKSEMGGKLDKSHQTITNYENGYIANDPILRESKLAEIANAYQVNLDELKEEYSKFLSRKEDIKRANVVYLRQYFEDIYNGIKNCSVLNIDNHTIQKTSDPQLAALVDTSLKRQLSTVASNIHDLISAYKVNDR